MSKYLLISAFANIASASNSRVLSIFDSVDGDKKVITTDFNHSSKSYYSYNESCHTDQVMLHVPSYKRNLSFKRILSHIVFAKRLNNYLKTLKDKPSVLYCTMPTSSSAYVCARYCKKHGIKYVIDVIDLWPDSLLPLVKGKSILKFILYPWSLLTRYAYKNANIIIGESKKYANEAQKYNDKANVFPIYIGVDIEYINNILSKRTLTLEKPQNEVWIAYAGSLGNSYDFESLLDAVNAINGKFSYKLWFIGDGVRREIIENYVAKHGLNAEITGFLQYDKLIEYLSYCDIAVNIFKQDTKVVYSYKFNDYVATNCFVLNSLEGETAEMVDAYKIGKNFNFNDNPLSSVLFDTIENWGKYASWSNNTKVLIAEKLDKKKIYSVIRDIIATH